MLQRADLTALLTVGPPCLAALLALLWSPPSATNWRNVIFLLLCTIVGALAVCRRWLNRAETVAQDEVAGFYKSNAALIQAVSEKDKVIERLTAQAKEQPIILQAETSSGATEEVSARLSRVKRAHQPPRLTSRYSCSFGRPPTMRNRRSRTWNISSTRGKSRPSRWVTIWRFWR
jgi:hypothetical protein